MWLLLDLWIILVINVHSITGVNGSNASAVVTNSSEVDVVTDAPEVPAESTDETAVETETEPAVPGLAKALLLKDEPATTRSSGIDSEERFPNGTKRVLDDIFNTRVEVWCKLQANTYNCDGGGHHERYYYDVLLEDCKLANIGKKCGVDLNVFSSKESCRSTCGEFGAELLKPHKKYGFNVTCRLQPDFGTCNDYHPRYFFSVPEKKCRGFSFSGCGGNKNRFESFEECSEACEPMVIEF